MYHTTSFRTRPSATAFGRARPIVSAIVSTMLRYAQRHPKKLNLKSKFHLAFNSETYHFMILFTSPWSANICHSLDNAQLR